MTIIVLRGNIHCRNETAPFTNGLCAELFNFRRSSMSQKPGKNPVVVIEDWVINSEYRIEGLVQNHPILNRTETVAKIKTGEIVEIDIESDEPGVVTKSDADKSSRYRLGKHKDSGAYRQYTAAVLNRRGHMNLEAAIELLKKTKQVDPEPVHHKHVTRKRQLTTAS